MHNPDKPVLAYLSRGFTHLIKPINASILKFAKRFNEKDEKNGYKYKMK